MKRITYDLSPFQAPSGRVLGYDDFVLLAAIEEARMIAWNDEEITFHAGFKSHVYVQGRNDLSDRPALLYQIAVRIKKTVDELPCSHGPQKSMIGIPTAGTQLAQAVSMVSRFEQIMDRIRLTDPLISFRSLRSVLKDHGKKEDQKYIDSADLSRHSYVTIENVVSTAKGMLDNFAHLRMEGYPIEEMHHIIFADWELGGIEKLQKQGVRNVHTLYKVRDIVAAFIYLELWPRERLEDVERRLSADKAQRTLSAL